MFSRLLCRVGMHSWWKDSVTKLPVCPDCGKVRDV